MGIFNSKDYSSDFKLIRKEIVGQSDKHLVKEQEIEEAVGRLENGFRILSDKINDIQTMLVNFTNESEKNVLVELPCEKRTEDKPKKAVNGSPIYEHKFFKKYSIIRYYDIDKAKFYSIGGNGSKRYFDLNFRQLVAIINGYNNGLSVPDLRKNPILKPINPPKIRSYIYIYRAGGFNLAIEAVARELGFNPAKLISHECDDL